jgi:hypothetical protein
MLQLYLFDGWIIVASCSFGYRDPQKRLLYRVYGMENFGQFRRPR